MNFKTLAMVWLIGIGVVCGKDVSVEDAFAISLPDSAKQKIRSPKSDNLPDTVLDKYSGNSFQLQMYRWPNISTSEPIDQIPQRWIKDKKWASVSEISVGETASGIPYVTFNAQINRDNLPPSKSVMTVLRSSKGVAYMFQMNGDPGTIATIRQSIRFE